MALHREDRVLDEHPRQALAGRRPDLESRSQNRDAGLARSLLVCALSLVACSSEGPGAVALFDLDGSDEDFFALPFPNSLHLGSDGTYDLSRVTREPGILTQYMDLIDARLDGAGTQSSIYFRFDGALDETSIAKSALLVDITPSSPDYGKRWPILTHFVADYGDFIGDNWLAIRPLDGFPLRERTTYAAVLTDSLAAKAGGKVRRSPKFVDAIEGALPAYTPLREWLATQGSLASQVVVATVFETRDTTTYLSRLRAKTQEGPGPVLATIEHQPGLDRPGLFHVYDGTYQAPNFQTGDAPYLTTGGTIENDSSGDPKIARTEMMRVSMSVPEGSMPAAGWPVVLYAHGTGGDFHSYLNDATSKMGRVTDSAGVEIARFAVLGIDQVLHGPRAPDGTDVEITFFNFQNIGAAHDNIRQGAADDFSLLRLAASVDITSAPGTGVPIKFDLDRVYFMGHSQGGLTGPLFVGSAPEVKAAVFSGAGGGLILSLLNKTEPVNIPQVVQALLRDPVDAYHPLLNFVQAYFEDVDPSNHARLMFREPPSGFSPKSIYQSLGLIDHYTPVPNIKALALALGVQPVEPMLDPIAGLEFTDLSWVAAPVVDNVAGGKATGVLCQYLQSSPSSDGHFVVQNVRAATEQATRFLATHAKDGKAKLLPSN